MTSFSPDTVSSDTSDISSSISSDSSSSWNLTVQHRGGKGLRCYKITEKTGYVIGVKTIKPEEEIMLITTEGIVIRMKSDSISVIGRNTSGVKLINIDADSDIKVASVAKVRFQEED